MKILIINGPNLNLLGTREPEIYGKQTYSDLVALIEDYSRQKNISVTLWQSNHEGEIIDQIHHALGKYDGLIINPGAYTHYSYAIFDAIKGTGITAIEVHLSNLNGRENFRQHSVIAAACKGQISGLGFYSYIAALDFFYSHLIQAKG